MPGLAHRASVFFAQHRNAVLAGGGVAAVATAMAVRKRAGGASSSSTDASVGYPAQVQGGGTVPTYDTTATDTYSQFSDALDAQRQWTQGALDNLSLVLTGRINKKIKRAELAKAPRPPKPHSKPKAHHHPKPKAQPVVRHRRRALPGPRRRARPA